MVLKLLDAPLKVYEPLKFETVNARTSPISLAVEDILVNFHLSKKIAKLLAFTVFRPT